MNWKNLFCAGKACLVAALLLAVIVPQHTAFADGSEGPYIDDSAVQQVLDVSAQYAIKSCLVQAGNTGGARYGIGKDSIINGAWTNRYGSRVQLSYYDDPADGTFNCHDNNGAVNGDLLGPSIEGRLPGIINRLGWTDLLAAACDMGATAYDHGKPVACDASAYTILVSQDAGKIQNAINKKLTSGNFTMEPKSYYAADWQALVSACKVQGGVEVKGPNPPDNAVKKSDGSAVVTNNTLVVPVVNVDGSLVYVRFGYTFANSIHAFAGNSPENGNGRTYNSCDEVAGDMNRHASSYAQYIKSMPSDQKKPSGAGGTKAGSLPSCQGGSLGWLICPLTEMFSSIISAIAKYIDGLLFFKPLIIGDNASGDAIYSLWRVVIVPANLLLVVAFLVVIFSQATSFGLSSYGIKKMLPRIIAAAILINLSYFLCAVAVDITNVIGAGVKGMMENVPLPNGTSLRGSTWVDWLATGVVGSLVTGTTVVTGAVFYIVPMLAAAVIAVLTAFLVVAARQVLITLMIIIAPLAFAALVLPNTNELFTKWRKAFAALLFMYPLIMLVFYGSMVVSKIVAVTAQQGTDPSINLIQQVLVLCILIFPLFSLPIIMKAAGGLLQRFGLWANDKSKGLIDRSNKWAKGRQARSTFSQMMNARKDAGDANASQRAARRMGTGFGQFASTVGMNKNTKGIMQAQIGDANDKLHAQQVTYEKRNVRSRYNASDRRDREQMAKDAADAAQRGDSVAYDAIMSHAADAGADEFSHTFTQTQKELRRRDPDSLKAGTKAHKTLSDGHKFIAATHGDKLSEKNRALGEVLRQADPTANIKAAMHNDAGARAYYGKAKPEAAANFSSDTARAAAEFLDDHVLEQLLTNSELMKTVSPSARDAYQAEYAGRKSGAFSRTGEGDVSRAASAVGSDANYFDY